MKVGLITSAGKGTRFYELGKVYPKSLLPYKEKPILIHQIEFLERQKCDEIRIVINPKFENLFLDILKKYNKSCILKYQLEQTGLSSAIYEGIKDLNNLDNVLINLGDVICNYDFIQFEGSTISIKLVEDYKRWCLYDRDKNIFYDKCENDPKIRTAVSGIYYLEDCEFLKSKLEYQFKNNIKINNEFQISEVLKFYNLKTIPLYIEDLGTLEDYLKYKDLKNSREFNNVEIANDYTCKNSNDYEKILKEVNWFKSLPDILKRFIPQIFSSEFGCYYMERIKGFSLRELYLFYNNDLDFWTSTFEKIFNILEKFESDNKKYKNNFLDFNIYKVKSRVKSIKFKSPKIQEYINELENFKIQDRYCIMHGDLCFSNILINKDQDLKLIDPRGDFFGSHYYEVAKLMHSVIYDYDFIDCELYSEFEIYNNGVYKIKEIFMKLLKSKYSKREIKFITLLTSGLFLSMIPLHSHNSKNQEQYFKIFLKSFEDYKNLKS